MQKCDWALILNALASFKHRALDRLWMRFSSVSYFVVVLDVCDLCNQSMQWTLGNNKNLDSPSSTVISSFEVCDAIVWCERTSSLATKSTTEWSGRWPKQFFSAFYKEALKKALGYEDQLVTQGMSFFLKNVSERRRDLPVFKGKARQWQHWEARWVKDLSINIATDWK